MNVKRSFNWKKGRGYQGANNHISNTVHQSLVGSLLEKGWSNNRSFLGVPACQLQSFEQSFLGITSLTKSLFKTIGAVSELINSKIPVIFFILFLFINPKQNRRVLFLPYQVECSHLWLISSSRSFSVLSLKGHTLTQKLTDISVLIGCDKVPLLPMDDEVIGYSDMDKVIFLCLLFSVYTGPRGDVNCEDGERGKEAYALIGGTLEGMVLIHERRFYCKEWGIFLFLHNERRSLPICSEAQCIVVGAVPRTLVQASLRPWRKHPGQKAGGARTRWRELMRSILVGATAEARMVTSGGNVRWCREGWARQKRIDLSTRSACGETVPLYKTYIAVTVELVSLAFSPRYLPGATSARPLIVCHYILFLYHHTGKEFWAETLNDLVDPRASKAHSTKCERKGKTDHPKSLSPRTDCISAEIRHTRFYSTSKNSFQWGCKKDKSNMGEAFQPRERLVQLEREQPNPKETNEYLLVRVTRDLGRQQLFIVIIIIITISVVIDGGRRRVKESLAFPRLAQGHSSCSTWSQVAAGMRSSSPSSSSSSCCCLSASSSWGLSGGLKRPIGFWAAGCGGRRGLGCADESTRLLAGVARSLPFCMDARRWCWAAGWLERAEEESTRLLAGVTGRSFSRTFRWREPAASFDGPTCSPWVLASTHSRPPREICGWGERWIRLRRRHTQPVSTTGKALGAHKISPSVDETDSLRLLYFDGKFLLRYLQGNVIFLTLKVLTIKCCQRIKDGNFLFFLRHFMKTLVVNQFFRGGFYIACHLTNQKVNHDKEQEKVLFHFNKCCDDRLRITDEGSVDLCIQIGTNIRVLCYPLFDFCISSWVNFFVFDFVEPIFLPKKLVIKLQNYRKEIPCDLNSLTFWTLLSGRCLEFGLKLVTMSRILLHEYLRISFTRVRRFHTSGFSMGKSWGHVPLLPCLRLVVDCFLENYRNISYHSECNQCSINGYTIFRTEMGSFCIGVKDKNKLIIPTLINHLIHPTPLSLHIQTQATF
ncbi:hypothetical protein VP01_435g2 [Puccinia sorghi]|uniref:Uncharacterized protein n=1 Tax=Puccinia sorghi TaxID=27349 RepID=A0A0L6UPU0_9BASI|nr:hypothetical protein VP01_435g2 [Puccinia sorghi]